MKYPIFIILIILTYNAFGQDNGRILKGDISFVTSSNIYVRFDNTEHISIGDTLKLAKTNSSCLIVKSKSSSSCVCALLSGCEIQKGDAVVYNYVPLVVAEGPSTIEPEFEPTIVEPIPESLYKENIRGSISASSYSIISSERDARHRIMGRLSISAEHIKGSKFSFNSYLNYQQLIGQSTTSSLQNNSLLRVYNLGVRYDVSPTLSTTIGRNINPKISSLGAIDGLQVEKYLGKSYVGAIVGFRPDIFDYGFNSNLLQYGGYVGTGTDKANFYSQSTLGFIEQRNGSETDRRYAYLQHSSTFANNLNLFSSLEVDLYSKLNGVAASDVRLTNLYVSARYRFSRAVNAMVSYDSRKRILYYKTYLTDIERLLDDDVARQGIRGRINIRPFKNILTGGSYSKRFQNDSENKSDNIYGYFTLSKLPSVGGRLSFTYNLNSSNYLKSNIASIRHSRDFFDGRLNADFYYRYVLYDYTKNPEKQTQHYYGTDLSFNINRKLLFSISGELSTFNQENSYRIYARIAQRF